MIELLSTPVIEESASSIPAQEDTRRLVTLRRVDDVQPIEGADAIEVVVIGGWKVVVKKGEFAPGDGCLYFEIDSFLPDGVPAWQFLVDKQPKMFAGKRGHKLRTIKLRGQISQGFVLQPQMLPQVAYVLGTPEVADALRSGLTPEELIEADMMRFGLDEYISPEDLNLTKLLGIKKWEAVLHSSLSGQAEGLFPSFIRKTDEERCQNIVNEIFGYESTVIPANAELNRPEFIRHATADRNAQYEVSIKLDGSSGTYFVRAKVDDQGFKTNQPEIGVCSRNLQLKISDANKENTFVRVLFDTGLNEALQKYFETTGHEIAVQGEVMGPNIQSNREGLSKVEFYVFKIFDIAQGKYLAPAARYAVLEALQKVHPIAKIQQVPILHKAITLDELGITNVQELLAFAEGPSINHKVREGLVFKRLDGQFSFKAISNQYLVKASD